MGLNPGSSYEMQLKNINYFTSASTNECGILKVKLPRNFPAIIQPYNGAWQYAVVKIDGSTDKSFYWVNREYNQATDVKPSQMNCSFVQSSGLPWITTVSKDSIYYWEGSLLPPNKRFNVAVIGNYDGSSGRDTYLNKKANLCGIATFSYYWSWGGQLGLGLDKKPGFVIDYDENFTLRKDDAVVRVTDWDTLNWYQKPICKSGQIYKSEQLLYQ